MSHERIPWRNTDATTEATHAGRESSDGRDAAVRFAETGQRRPDQEYGERATEAFAIVTSSNRRPVRPLPSDDTSAPRRRFPADFAQVDRSRASPLGSRRARPQRSHAATAFPPSAARRSQRVVPSPRRGDRGLQHLVLRVVRPFMTSEGLRYESRQGAGRASIRSMSL
jgi:hypothetical protein